MSPDQVRREIDRLAHRGMDVGEFSLAAAHALRRAVPFDGVCVVTLDPATHLPTGHTMENALPDAVMPRYTEIEVVEEDFNKFAALARAPLPAATLSAATDGRLDRSLRHRELRRPNGYGGDELRAAWGEWGGIVMMRETGRTDFTPADVNLLAALSTHLAEGLRRALLFGALSDASADAAPGLILFAPDDSFEVANAAAEAWLDEFDDDVPVAIRAIAQHARSGGAGPSTARLRTPSGQWVVARGSMIGDRAAVILDTPRAAELAPMIAEAYGLTERERAVTQLVAQGLSTKEIGARLFVSPYTVQDHLKSVFEKTGVGSRRELVARLYLDHYANGFH
ncbi:MAG TPA: LuxR C-terminal-related transcriptional regulator [Solirubrobacter sp.]|jgi:DNA-binding CsgD family transcriptional regulator|nr:LuxR C-terminal-related transcriptional regulator [Solirubrobacter sp.]